MIDRLRWWWQPDQWGVRLGIWFGYHLPMPLKYWAANDLIAKATSGRYSSTVVPELTAMDALKRAGRLMGWAGFGSDEEDA
jgi:hypothetical protein